MRHRTRITFIIFGVCAALVAMLAGVACTPEEAPARPPPPGELIMSMPAQAPDTVRFLSTWPPVVFQGDTIRRFRRTLTRTDTAQDLTIFGVDDNASVNAVGSETFEIPGPGEGETGSYRYCLRSVRADGVTGRDSTCAIFQYTAPVEVPPPPDSIDVSEQASIFYDSVKVYPKVAQTVPEALYGSVGFPAVDTSLLMDEALVGFHLPDASWRDSSTVRRLLYRTPTGTLEVLDTVAGIREETVQLTAALYQGDRLVGCSGMCDTLVVEPALWDRGMPVRMAGRPGYRPGREWVATRLPWFRQLATVRGESRG